MRGRWAATAAVALGLGACDPSPSAPVDAGGMTAPDANVRCTWDAVDAGVPGLDLDAPGPYLAGVRTLSVTDPSRDRTLPVEVWYPVARDAPEGAENAYHLDLSLGRLGSACTPARRDAAAAPGPWPVVLFSHGFGGIRFQSYFLTEHLATHGFVVVAPDHVGNTLADFARLGDDALAAQSAVDRPLDVLFLLARLDEGWIATWVATDLARVAIAGHSFGAWTAVEAGRREARLRVVVPLAPGFRAPSSPSIAGELRRPLLIFGGSTDRTTPFDTEQRPAYDAASAPKALALVEGAGHMDFTDVCAQEAVRGLFDDGCDPASVDPELVKSRVRVLSLAFLRRYLLDDVSQDARLAPAAVSALPGITYWYEPGP